MNITGEQLAALSRHSGSWLEWDKARGVARLVRGPGLGRVDPDRELAEPPRYLVDLVGPRGPATALRPLLDRVDHLRWRHIEFQQFVQVDGTELALYGSRLVIHVTPDGVISSVQSSCYRDVDVEPVKPVSVTYLPEILRIGLRRAENVEAIGFKAGPLHPMVGQPRLVVYPWRGGFTVAYVMYGYAVVDSGESRHELAELCKVFVDAETGQAFLTAPMTREVSHLNDGRGVTPLGGPYTERPLFVFRPTDTGPYELRDTEHEREIITYDLSNLVRLTEPTVRLQELAAGNLPVSEDRSGVWTTLRKAKNPPATFENWELAPSQQPEVDLHYHLRGVYEWYHAVCGRVGWVDDRVPDRAIGSRAIHGLAHVIDLPGAHKVGATAYLAPVDRPDGHGGNGREFFARVELGDGDVGTYDYLAGCRFTVCHEYQHLVTDFSHLDDALEPGLDYTEWVKGLAEGVSDAIAALCTDDWEPRDELSPQRQIFRNLAFPRDHGAYSRDAFDHFADVLPSGNDLQHRRGTVLAHAAFLAAAGGVHRRQGRHPEYIPVRALGRHDAEIPDKPPVPDESHTLQGISDVAPIFYRAITEYCATLGAASGQSTLDAGVFRGFRDACEMAAIDLHTAGSREHRTIVLAFHAVGLPPERGYGADVTLLPPAAQWAASIPYVALQIETGSSLDLFVNNGTGSGWHALRSTPAARFENDVYCRVRNIGDAEAHGVTVRFDYRESGNPAGPWQPVTDANGNVQVLAVGTLVAGSANFPDSAQAAPPASASVRWCLPVADADRQYQLRATVTCANDVNPFDKEVESEFTSAAAP